MEPLKKEGTPPPLLLMPSDGGLTMNASSSGNVLMPVIQTGSNFIMPDEDGEADSFLGQSPPKTTGLYFNQSQNTVSDPFAQIGDSFTPLQLSNNNEIAPLPAQPQPPTHTTTQSVLQPTNKFRQQGPRQYAPSPIATYVSASVQDPQVAPTPFTPAFKENVQNMPSFIQMPSQTSVHNVSMLAQSPQGIYQPVQMHWCFCLEENGREMWRPFSLVDSLNLEESFNHEIDNPEGIVQTDGGRYDVELEARLRHAVYWKEEPSKVRRCSWFYKRESDGKYVPYSEQFSEKLETEYRNAVVNNIWHKRLEFEGGETIVMHNPNVIVHFQPSSQPDEWGNVQSIPSLMGDQMRPRVVKRGVDDFETISDGEPSRVDHVVFVVHGIGSACDMKLRSIVECVDDFRSISLNLLKSHFKSHVIDGRVGRVEFLPVHWHSALHSDATGIDKQLKLITLRSTVKLREFVNDTLLDVLFYTSPSYCQTICDTVTTEMNRLYALFLSRHPYFPGSTSVIGHSLGSSILYDILSHQVDPLSASSHPPETETFVTPDAQTLQEASPNIEKVTHTNDVNELNGVVDDSDITLTLSDLLGKVGLQDKINLFEKEQIDMDSINMCTEEDLKDLGLPMGPRKKLRGLLKNEQDKKAKQQRAAAERIRHENDERQRLELLKEKELAREADLASKIQSSGARGSIAVEYLQGVAGTGQPFVQYHQLDFRPQSLFALGSPIGVLLTVRGVNNLGEDYQLPTCPRLFNIYHPFDPVAYRLEPLLNSTNTNVKPVLIPHHKGRKRLHLELKEGLTRVGTDLKQKIIATLRTTWNSFNEFAKAHRGETDTEDDVNDVIKQITETTEDSNDTASLASCHDEDIPMGALNAGRRIDYVLQEKPIESFNDYLFALASHLCYWESEDTVLMILKEIYAPDHIYPSTSDQTPRIPSISPIPSDTPSPTIPQTHHLLHQPAYIPQVTGPGVPLSNTSSSVQSHPGAFTGPPPLTGFVRTK